MKPVTQQFIHNPEAGQFGDCQRAVIASLLELAIEEVPHFLQEAQGDPTAYWEGIQTFLRQHGYAYLVVPARSGATFFGLDEEPVYHEISGPSPRRAGVFHAVVGCSGRIAFDPHPDRTGLAGDPAEWEYAYLVKTGNKLYTAPQAPAPEPVGFMSPKQLPTIRDPEDESGHYIPMRKTAAGLFTLALYTAPHAPAPKQADDMGLHAEMAGIQTANMHLSALVDELRASLQEMTDAFKYDGMGCEYEDGEVPIIDRARSLLEMVAAPQAPAPEVRACEVYSMGYWSLQPLKVYDEAKERGWPVRRLVIEEAAPKAPAPERNYLQDIAACIGVGGYNGANDEQLYQRICDEFARVTAPQAPEASNG